VSKEGHILGEHLLHADARAHPVCGAVNDEQLLARGAVAIADHAGVVGGAEKTQEVLKRGERFPGT
jgi:hypothetical protein